MGKYEGVSLSKASKLAKEIAGDIILDALMRRYPDKQDFATNEIEVQAVAKVIDHKLSNIRQVVEPLSRGAVELYDYPLIKRVHKSLKIGGG